LRAASQPPAKRRYPSRSSSRSSTDLGPKGRTCQPAAQCGQIRGGAVRPPFPDLARTVIARSDRPAMPSPLERGTPRHRRPAYDVVANGPGSTSARPSPQDIITTRGDHHPGTACIHFHDLCPREVVWTHGVLDKHTLLVSADEGTEPSEHRDQQQRDAATERYGTDARLLVHRQVEHSRNGGQDEDGDVREGSARPIAPGLQTRVTSSMRRARPLRAARACGITASRIGGYGPRSQQQIELASRYAERPLRPRADLITALPAVRSLARMSALLTACSSRLGPAAGRGWISRSDLRCLFPSRSG
jgi:hypothetical protein